MFSIHVWHVARGRDKERQQCGSGGYSRSDGAGGQRAPTVFESRGYVSCKLVEAGDGAGLAANNLGCSGTLISPWCHYQERTLSTLAAKDAAGDDEMY